MAKVYHGALTGLTLMGCLDMDDTQISWSPSSNSTTPQENKLT